MKQINQVLNKLADVLFNDVNIFWGFYTCIILIFIRAFIHVVTMGNYTFENVTIICGIVIIIVMQTQKLYFKGWIIPCGLTILLINFQYINVASMIVVLFGLSSVWYDLVKYSQDEGD